MDRRSLNRSEYNIGRGDALTSSGEFGDDARPGAITRAAGFISLALAISAVAFLIGCGRSGPPEKPIDDAAIVKNVKAKLAAEFGRLEDRQVTQLERGADQQTVTYISVTSLNGFVTLTGEVRGKRAKTKAGEIARGVDQVVSVNNNLSMAPGYSDDAVGDK